MSLSQKIKELRERTGAGMLDCKNILVEVNEDMDAAIKLLREKGLAKAAKKADRIASEGLVKFMFSDDNSKAGIVEVNSETDFVAKNAEFISFVDSLAELSVNADTSDVAEFSEKSLGDVTVAQAITDLTAKIGEKINLRRVKHFNSQDTKYIGYLHGEGKIGVVVGANVSGDFNEVSAVLRDVAMQIASMKPMFLSSDDVDPEYLAKEKEMLVKQALNEGKPENIVEKMVEGRLKKELKETCLLEQKFVKNEELTVQKMLEEESKKTGCEIKLTEFVRFEVGEGIEKKEENFAEEVAKQMS